MRSYATCFAHHLILPFVWSSAFGMLKLHSHLWFLHDATQLMNVDFLMFVYDCVPLCLTKIWFGFYIHVQQYLTGIYQYTSFFCTCTTIFNKDLCVHQFVISKIKRGDSTVVKSQTHGQKVGFHKYNQFWIPKHLLSGIFFLRNSLNEIFKLCQIITSSERYIYALI